MTFLTTLDRLFRRLPTVVSVSLLLAVAGGACGDIERQPRQSNERPEAALTVRGSTIVGEQVILDASASYDTDGRIVEYRFLLGDSDEELITADSTLTYAYSAPGDYVVTLSVVDNLGGKSSVAITLLITL